MTYKLKHLGRFQVYANAQMYIKVSHSKCLKIKHDIILLTTKPLNTSYQISQY